MPQFPDKTESGRIFFAHLDYHRGWGIAWNEALNQTGMRPSNSGLRFNPPCIYYSTMTKKRELILNGQRHIGCSCLSKENGIQIESILPVESARVGDKGDSLIVTFIRNVNATWDQNLSSIGDC